MVASQTYSTSNTRVHYVDIGITKSFGHPVKTLRFLSKKKYLEYVNFAWTKLPSKKYDVVIIDGRFRVASALKSTISNSRPFHLVVDDYKSRQQYWVIAECVGLPKRVLGETAFFEISEDINVKIIKENGGTLFQ